MINYIIYNLAALSVALNTLTGGSYRNTFSARCGYQYYYNNKTWAGIAVKIIDTLFFFQDLHCYNEMQNELTSFNSL